MSIHKRSQRRAKQAPRRFTSSNRSCSSRYRVIDPEVVFNDLLPDLKEANNGFAWACCPFHNDNNPSLCVNLISGWYRCASSSCGATGPNIVGFVGRLLALENHEARRYVEAHYG
jgi:hypothetical protein